MTGSHTSRLNAALADRYRIERELGEGGMATVYLAGDLKHERKVALKVLKPELAAVVGAERFVAEIRTTANLRHPHILPLFDSGEADGFLYYVMPYVEGESLRERLDREKQLPVDEAVAIATKVAGALQAAHDAGVIHRDIKPANILLEKGEPVVADFGIALAVQEAGGGRLTETGLSLGTPYYMSPEQATGDRAPDARSDVYALGSVLYEMLTGDPPHTGSTAQAVLGQIITGEPVFATRKRPAVPAHVDAAIRRALEKLPADRFGTAAEMAGALGNPSFRHGELETRVASRGDRRLTGVLAVTTVVLAIALLWQVLGSGARAPQSTLWFDIVPTPAVEYPEWGTGFVLTADGSEIVYSGEDEDGERALWRRSLHQPEGERIRGTEGGEAAYLSADGRTIAFFAAQDIRTVPFGGGPAVTVGQGWDPAWGDDGSLYFWREKTVFRLPPEGGEAVAWTPQMEADFAGLQPLPGGAGILTTIRRSTANWSRIAVIGPEGGEPREILDGVTAFYSNSGHIVYATSDRTLWAAPFDLETLEPGQGVALWDSLWVRGPSYTTFALSEDGDLIFQRPPPDRPSEWGWLDRDGDFTPLGWEHGMGFVAISPDGSAVTFSRGGNQWVRRFDENLPVQLTFAGGGSRSSWTPEGDSVLLDAEQELRTVAADGSGQPVPSITDELQVLHPQWSRDRQWIVYRTNINLTGSGDIRAIRPGTDSASTDIVATPALEAGHKLSPDGDWLAYHSEETGRAEVYVTRFPNSDGGRWIVSTGGGTGPVWSRDGSELIYASGDSLWVVPVRLGAAFAKGAAQPLASAEEFALSGLLAAPYDIAPDRRILVRRYLVDAQPNPIVYVQNFATLLEERLGGGAP
jgi:serine/threonine-protein kinase